MTKLNSMCNAHTPGRCCACEGSIFNLSPAGFHVVPRSLSFIPNHQQNCCQKGFFSHPPTRKPNRHHSEKRPRITARRENKQTNNTLRFLTFTHPTRQHRAHAPTETFTLVHLCVQFRGCHGDHSLDPLSNLGYESARYPRCMGPAERVHGAGAEGKPVPGVWV